MSVGIFERMEYQSMSKNEKLLASFTEYCIVHPEERFWQALRNWSEHPFIWVSDYIPIVEDRDEVLVDTFYMEDK